MTYAYDLYYWKDELNRQVKMSSMKIEYKVKWIIALPGVCFAIVWAERLRKKKTILASILKR